MSLLSALTRCYGYTSIGNHRCLIIRAVTQLPDLLLGHHYHLLIKFAQELIAVKLLGRELYPEILKQQRYIFY